MSAIFSQSIIYYIYLLLFVSLFLLVTEELSEPVVVTQREVILQMGTQGVLPCRVHSDDDIALMIWYIQTPNSKIELVELNFLGDIPERFGPGYETKFYNISDEFSLIIKDVKIQDRGTYICEMVTLEESEPFNNNTIVSVFGMYMYYVYLIETVRNTTY